MTVVRGLLDEDQVVCCWNPYAPPVQPQSPSPGGLHPGGVLVFRPQIVACNDRVKSLTGDGAGARAGAGGGTYRLF